MSCYTLTVGEPLAGTSDRTNNDDAQAVLEIDQDTVSLQAVACPGDDRRISVGWVFWRRVDYGAADTDHAL